MGLDRLRIVLVRPRVAGNVGAIARAMRNFAMSDLVLVAPEMRLNDRSARQRSARGESVLQRARVVTRLEDAVADCSVVLGTSARRGGKFRSQSCGDLPSATRLLCQSLAGGIPSAIVFGPERTGLTTDEIALCGGAIRLESNAAYPVLNLAQAAAIILHAVHDHWVSEKLGSDGPVGDREEKSEASTFDEREWMFQALRNSFAAVGFLRADASGDLMRAVRRILERANLSHQEVRLLLGLSRQLDWYVREHPPRGEGSSPASSSP